MKNHKNLEKLSILLVVWSVSTSRAPAAGVGPFEPVDITQVKVEGEIGRRIDNTINNNVLVLDTDILLLDEPLSNLDAKLRRTMRSEIREIQKRLAMTMLYVTGGMVVLVLSGFAAAVYYAKKMERERVHRWPAPVRFVAFRCQLPVLLRRRQGIPRA